MANIAEMLNKIDLVHISDSANINPDAITKAYKLQQLALFSTLRAHNPHLKANELAKQMGTSSTTLRRMRDDVNMASPYRYIKSKTKSTASLPCKSCSKLYATPRGLADHEAKCIIPSNIPNIPSNIFSCENCQKVCKSKAGLSVHMRSCDKSVRGGADLDSIPKREQAPYTLSNGKPLHLPYQNPGKEYGHLSNFIDKL